VPATACGATRSTGLALLVACAALTAGTGCRVVRDDERDKGAPAGAPAGVTQAFDAAGWVASVWDAQVLPLYEAQAVPIGPVLEALAGGLDAAGQRYGRRADAEGSPWTFTVKGSGRVVSVDTESRAGTMVVAVETPTGPQEVTLQLGPVVRGTALRDSLPFFKFGDVTNQIEFAQVARALNDRAVAGLAGAVDGLRAPGTQVAFSGAMNLASGGDPRQVTPVALRAGGK